MTPTGLTVSDILGAETPLSQDLPTPVEVVGVGVGERHWYHHEIRAYLDALAEVSPRVRALGAQGRTHGGRPLTVYAVSSARNIARLDEILAERSGLADPGSRMSLNEVPAVVHLGASVHGDEPSGANAMPLIAWYLAGAQDPAVVSGLDSVVVLLNPVFNPDGLDRFAMQTNSLSGRVPSPDPNDDEHQQAFVTGRTNYYWFDLNRDWLAHQHPESQAVVALFQRWLPNIQLDLHEMGTDTTYFFQPGVPSRTHPLVPDLNQELTRKIAGFFQGEFDRDGTLYFSEERFDDFYMGKASTYADLFGCVGLLCEQASSRGAVQDSVNGRLTFPLTISNQFRMSLAVVRAAVGLRSELLSYQRQSFANGLKAGRERGGWYLATADGDPSRLAEFVRILRGHGIRVDGLAESVEVDGQLFPAGRSIAVPLGQERYPFLESLWERRTNFGEAIFYDISAWTLPLAFNLRHTVEPVAKVRTAELETDAGFTGTRALPDAGLAGYLIDWRDSCSPALLAEILGTGAVVRVATRPFSTSVAGGDRQDFGYGTLFVSGALAEGIPAEARDILTHAAARGLPVYGVTGSGTSEGIDLGSREFKVLRPPKVLLLTGPGISQYEAGEVWHLFDQRIGMTLTMVEWTRLPKVDLDGFTHLILVGGADQLRFLDSGVADRVRSFVENGGVLWAQGRAVEWAITSEIAEGTWRKQGEGGAGNSDGAQRRPFASARDDRALEAVSGAIFSASLDPSHPIGYGFTDDVIPIFRIGTRFLEPSANPYATPLQYSDEPLLAGYISEANLRLLAGSAVIMVEERKAGRIVLSLDAPAFRGFWWGTQRLLVNSVFFGDLLETP
ncbi:MAG: M14 family zinc carboxypeptidase [Opitutaceae bacterium]